MRGRSSGSSQNHGGTAGARANGDILWVDVTKRSQAKIKINQLLKEFEAQEFDHQLVILYRRPLKEKEQGTFSNTRRHDPSISAIKRRSEVSNLANFDMVLISPRIHFYEIDDQAWFPGFLREKVQAGLTLAWTFKAPFLQKTSPAQLVATTLYNILSHTVKSYTYVDFCAGAGGPTPYIERFLNEKIQEDDGRITELTEAAAEDGEAVKFVLTDIQPHIPAWTALCKKSDNLSFIAKSVDASNAPADLLENDGKKVFRLFNLAFHHFDDPLAKAILRNTVETSDGFGIFELQERTISSMITVTAMGILMFLISPYYYWNDPVHLFFTYIIPIVPAVLVLDGYVSSLRTRTASEVEALMKASGANCKGWKLISGRATHTWPTGYMTYIIAVKK